MCVYWICMHFFHNIYIHILYYCTIYHDLWPSLVGSNRVQGSRDIGKSANPMCVTFFWLDSTRIGWISFGMFFNWAQALSTSQGILLHTHCTTASVFSWQNPPWQVMADQSRWFIKEKPLEDRIKVLYGMWTFHDLLNDSKNQSYAANVVIQNHAKKTWKPMLGVSLYVIVFPNPVSESLYNYIFSGAHRWMGGVPHGKPLKVCTSATNNKKGFESRRTLKEHGINLTDACTIPAPHPMPIPSVKLQGTMIFSKNGFSMFLP